MVVTLIVGFIGGMIGAEIHRRIRQMMSLPEEIKPATPRGPFLYKKVGKKKPIFKTDADLYKKEQEAVK